MKAWFSILPSSKEETIKTDEDKQKLAQIPSNDFFFRAQDFHL